MITYDGDFLAAKATFGQRCHDDARGGCDVGSDRCTTQPKSYNAAKGHGLEIALLHDAAFSGAWER